MSKLKNNFKEWYQPHDSFVVRNPLFPVEVFFNWKTDNTDSGNTKEILKNYLRDFYLQPIAQEALYIGSPDLHEQLLLWLDNKIEKTDKKEKTELSLVKYMIRMCTRCTPYGLFASCTSGNISETTRIDLTDKKNLHRKGRLDMDYVCEVHAHLLKQKEISDQLLFFPNTSLYSIGEQLRYIEHRFREKSGRSYHLVQIELSDYLQKILQAAKNGSTPIQLASAITDGDVSGDEAKEFIYELIHNQVLVSEIEPTVTGEEYFHALINKLKTLQHTEKYVNQFEKAVEEFKGLTSSFGEGENSGADNKHQRYSNIIRDLKELEVPLHLKTLIQVDSYCPANTCTVSKKVQNEILLGASLIQLLTADNPEKDSFSDFKNAFRNRYESQWIPLAEVLDTESGTGYGKFATGGMEESPLIDKLPIGNGQTTTTQQISDAETYKWQLYQDAVAQNKTEVFLDDKIIEQLLKKETTSAGLPDSICMMLKINAASAEEIDNGNYTVTLNSPSGPSGGNLLGRFCHLNAEIEKLTQSVLQSEEAHQPDCVYAEIVHLPESRIGNILMRPVLRKYEIPYLCGTTLSEEFQIPVTDLLVGIEGDKVVLRSKKLNKQVIPRMTTAHNFSMTTLPVYQFLCDLQYQHIKHIGWNWGILDSRPFLPRVSYNKFILTKARWILTKDDVKDCEKKSEDEVMRVFSEVQKNKNLPEYVLLSQGDNELVLYLKNIFCIRLLLNEISKSQNVMLTEALDVPGQCWIKSPEGRHAGEFIFAFSKKIIQPSETKPVQKTKPELFPLKRIFPVGSEWLYTKIYCGTKTTEKILCEVLKPLTEELLSEKLIDKYFFIRYRDEGGHHIRIRFHNAAQNDFWKEIIARLQERIQPSIENHSVHNVQFETYQREVERYGFDTMELSENIFYYQSLAILNFISLLDGDEGEQYRWQIALKAVDMILDDFQYTLPQKKDLVESLNKNFADEFKVGAPEQKKISERFSGSKKIIQYVMNEGQEEDENLKSGIGAFIMEDFNYRNTIEEILNTTSVHHDLQQVNRLMSSYLHMFINRMFVSNQRKVELVVYDYLLKYYESKIAREKNKNKISEVAEVSSDK